MTTSTAKTAICYGRFSTTEQSKGYSLERQKTKAIEFATLQGWTVEKFIFDEGKSAFHGRNLQRGAALYDFELEASEGLHKGKVLVVENIDRLSRQGARAVAKLIWGLNECGVDVATYHDDQIYRAENSDMLEIFGMILKAQMGHEESRKKSQRIQASWENRYKGIAAGTHNKPLPHVPHWVDFEDGVYSLNEYRTQVLNEIYDWYLAGEGIHRIVTKLNDRNEPIWTIYKNRNQNGWFYSYIYRLLTKRTVLGEYITLKGETIATDFFPQAVSTDKFNQVQSLLGMKKGNHKRNGNLNRNLLTHLVFCWECGGGAHFLRPTESTQTYTKISGEVVTYQRKGKSKLRCDRARRKLQCTNDFILNYDTIEATILDGLLPELITRHTVSDRTAGLRERIANQVRQRAADEGRLANIVEAIADGQGKALLAKMAELEGAVERHTQEIEATQKELDIELAKPSDKDDITLIQQLRSELESDDPDIRIPARGRVNIALRRLLKRIELVNDSFKVWISNTEWYHFDENGTMIESEVVWKAA